MGAEMWLCHVSTVAQNRPKKLKQKLIQNQISIIFKVFDQERSFILESHMVASVLIHFVAWQLSAIAFITS